MIPSIVHWAMMRPGLRAPSKLVLLILAANCGEAGDIQPLYIASMSTLSGLDHRSVQRHMRYLEQAGLVISTYPPGQMPIRRLNID
jgi:DNA-binding transcriptional ArsR family regulator